MSHEWIGAERVSQWIVQAAASGRLKVDSRAACHLLNAYWGSDQRVDLIVISSLILVIYRCFRRTLKSTH